MLKFSFEETGPKLAQVEHQCDICGEKEKCYHVKGARIQTVLCESCIQGLSLAMTNKKR